MTNRVNPTVHAMEPAQALPGIDCVFPKADPDQLPARHDPMLPFGEFRNRRIGCASLQFPAYATGNCRLGGHAAMVSTLASRVVRSV
jgi:hypothetical protein